MPARLGGALLQNPAQPAARLTARQDDRGRRQDPSRRRARTVPQNVRRRVQHGPMPAGKETFDDGGPLLAFLPPILQHLVRCLVEGQSKVSARSHFHSRPAVLFSCGSFIGRQFAAQEGKYGLDVQPSCLPPREVRRHETEPQSSFLPPSRPCWTSVFGGWGGRTLPVSASDQHRRGARALPGRCGSRSDASPQRLCGAGRYLTTGAGSGVPGARARSASLCHHGRAARTLVRPAPAPPDGRRAECPRTGPFETPPGLDGRQREAAPSAVRRKVTCRAAPGRAATGGGRAAAERPHLCPARHRSPGPGPGCPSQGAPGE